MTGQKNAFLEELDRAVSERRFMEGRLTAAGNMLWALCMVYAGFASAACVCGLVYEQPGFQTVSAALTIALSLLVMVFCMQKGALRAQRLHAECAELEKMRPEAEKADEADELRRRIVEMTMLGEPVSAHERRALLHMHDRTHKAEERRLFGYEKFLYWFAEIALIVLRMAAFLAPAAAITLAAVGLL